MRKLALATCLWLLASTGLAQDPNSGTDTDQPSTFERLRSHVGAILGAARQLGDWDRQSGYMFDAATQVYRQNGWNSEADNFSLDLMRSVESIPPWEINQRFDTFVGVISDRYYLDERQEAALRRMIVAENARLFAKHSGRIMSYATEAIQTRAAGEPFTADQVARWTRTAQPVFRDSRVSVERLAKEFSEQLDADQRQILERDLAAANNRMDTMERMAQGWMRGEWSAADWGMQNDPIQMAGEERVAAAAEQENAQQTDDSGSDAGVVAGVVNEAPRQEPPPTPVKPTKNVPRDDDRYARYVRAFIDKFQLNDEQQQRAWLFHKEVVERDATLRRKFDPRIEAADAGSDARTSLSTARDHALDRLFDQLKRRLERLPTTKQRQDAKPVDLDAAVNKASADVAEKPDQADKPTKRPRRQSKPEEDEKP
ncbi:MAG: hypothetical protein KDA32_12335 [Phycisphaerales bacterium]|nr:hypothetical protein [Phycisphaerales bacterium]